MSILTGMRWGSVITVASAGLVAFSACGSGGASPSASTTDGSSTSPNAAISRQPTGHAAAPALIDWPTYHGNMSRTGVSRSMPPVRGPLTRITTPAVDGQVFASPIAIGGLTIIATENDSVYAFDRSYQQVWHQTLGSPSPTEERQCGDINPLGITGTPVYDGSTGLIYVVAEQSGVVRHQLYALRVSSGDIAWSRSVDLPGVSARDMQQRGALAVTGGRVWVSYGAQAGDCGNYKGRVVGVPLDGTGATIYYSPPTQRGGGIWNPNGPTVDSAGNLLVVSANGAAFPGDAYDHTNTVLKLTPNLRLVDSFAPSNWALNNRLDLGLGSQGVALIGNTWAVLGGKSGPVYVLRQNHLGGIGGQVSMRNICPSYGGAAVNGNIVYLPCVDGVRAVRVDSRGNMTVLWHAAGDTNGSPVIGGGRVWVLAPQSGVLHALNPLTGRSLAQLNVGQANRFATPALYGSDVIVPTLGGFAVVRTS